MKVTQTPLPAVLIITPVVRSDARGSFSEVWNSRAFSAAVGSDVEFVQDNQSQSVAAVVRGMHYQLPPFAQGKLVRVGVGEVFDVAVDVRRSSSTFGEWFGLRLSAENRLQLWIPPGFAHGFKVLSDGADLLYKTTSYFAPESDRAIHWNDPDVGVEWPDSGHDPLLSERDEAGPLLEHADTFK